MNQAVLVKYSEATTESLDKIIHFFGILSAEFWFALTEARYVWSRTIREGTPFSMLIRALEKFCNLVTVFDHASEICARFAGQIGFDDLLVELKYRVCDKTHQ